jgi:cysteine desulfurase
MHANNEVGTVQDIEAISRIAHRAGALMHSDCAQSCGKIPVKVGDLGVDLLSVAGHKLYAPKGIGALYVRSGVSLPRLLHGGGQEMGLRAGTENVIHIVGLGESCEMTEACLGEHGAHLEAMRDRLADGLRAIRPTLVTNGHPVHRLPNTLSVSFSPLAADAILENLDGVAASAGAACHADEVEISGVLRAMGLDEKRARGTIRFSTGRFTTAEEIDLAIERIGSAIDALAGGQ